MSLTSVAQQPTPAPQPQTPAAALQLVKASLAGLAQRLGQVLPATVVGTDTEGLTQLRLGVETLVVKLSAPLPPGTQIQLSVQPGPSGSPVLSVVQPGTPAPLPLPALPTPAMVHLPEAPVQVSTATPAAPSAPPSMAQPAGTVTVATPATPPGAAAAPTGAVPVPVSAGTAAPTAANAVPGATTASTTAEVAHGTAPQPAPAATSMPAGTTTARAHGAPPATTATSTGAAPRAVYPTARSEPTPAATTATRAAPLPLNSPTQAAARQDSIVPLLQTLGALQGRLSALPSPVAEAALKVLANRIGLDRGPPSGATLKQAVLGAGVVSEPGRATSGGDVKAALLNLRAGLINMLDGEAVAAIAPVVRRAAPPMRDTQPRAVKAEPLPLTDPGTPREAGRTLLHQTDAALSRLKLTQLASSPAPEARAAITPGMDFVVELPMTLGQELALAQLRVQRDGSGKGKKSERGWNVRFAVSFSAIGEVGAQVSLMGETTNVTIWAEEAETADALEAMLPELAPALGAKGLNVGAIRLRRGVPAAERAPSGRLMDTLT